MSIAETVSSAFQKVFGSSNERQVRRMVSAVERVLELGPGLRKLSDADLCAKTEAFRKRLKDGETVDDLLPEAFAVVKEACRRLVGHSWEAGGALVEWNMVPYDVQLIGGIVLHDGKIAEMVTGEGKTLVATLPCYLNALPGKGVHVVTVNDYLARRDCEWMRPVFASLGLTCAAIQHDMENEERKAAYGCDITYGTNSEFGFDYLRDNMKFDIEDYVQRGHHYAIVDEVDNILIDEARTPLIISGAVEREGSQHFNDYRNIVKSLVSAQRKIAEKKFDTAMAAEGDERTFELLQVRHGDPKNKRLSQYLTDEKGVLRDMNRMESLLNSERRTEELDQGLLYAMSERDHSVEFTEEGMDFLLQRDADLKDIIVMPDLQGELDRVDASEMPPDEKEAEKARLSQDFFEKKERRNAIDQLLRASALFERDIDYVVNQGQVVIVDEFTGRMMPGRRYSDGLHQALEAKEGVKVAKATQTIATITLQNYFRMYDKLAGMTGTAATEASEFYKIYKLDVVVIPTNRPLIRKDHEDVVYRTREEKAQAILEEIVDVHRSGRPVLVGTVSIEASESLSRKLSQRGVKHEVLNAKQHAREAMIVSKAGFLGNVTIATNMAGRGTDIVLGGFEEKELIEHWKHWDLAPKDLKGGLERPDLEDRLTGHWGGMFLDENTVHADGAALQKALDAKWKELGFAPLRLCGNVADLGGLHIVGTERHEARRIDNQLRGRAGRQGDPGSSRFFLSLEDDLMRVFGSDSVSSILERLGMEKGQAIESRLVTRSIGSAQRRVEQNNFAIRKRLLEYDEVMDQQRKVVYGLRRDILGGDGVRDTIMGMVERSVARAVDLHAPANLPSNEWHLDDLCQWMLGKFGVGLKPDDIRETTRDALESRIADEIDKRYGEREKAMGKEGMENLGKGLLLRAIDTRWKDHLYDMDMLRSEINWRSLAQQDPTVAYKKEGFETFQEMMEGCEEEVTGEILLVGEDFGAMSDLERLWDVSGMRHEEFQSYREQAQADLAAAEAAGADAAPKPEPIRLSQPKISRNAPCPCGSGKKYKKCCGK